MPTFNSAWDLLTALVLASLAVWLVQTAITLTKRHFLIARNGCKLPRVANDASASSQRPGDHVRLMSERFRRYGRTFVVNSRGKSNIFTIEPKNLQSVFASDFRSWGVSPLRSFPFEPLAGQGIMTSDGRQWEHSRNLIRPMFSRSQLADLSSLRLHTARLLQLMRSDGTSLDLKPLFDRFALDTSTEFLFGQSVESLSSSTTLDTKAFLAAYNYGQLGVGKRMSMPFKWNVLHRDAKFWNACRVARDFVGKHVDLGLRHIQEGKTSPSERGVLAHALAAETDNRDEILAQLLNIFLPAHDATGVALSNVFFNLSRHPEVYERLRREVCAISEEDITFEQLKRCTYLNYVLKETLRLNPPIAQMNRIACQDTILPTGAENGAPIFVKKGTVVATSFYELHRQPDFFGEDALQFKPERWETHKALAWSYLPFSGGPRTCIGQQMALTEAGYVIARIAQNFRVVENVDPELDYVPDWKLTTTSKNGVMVRLVR